LPNPTNCFHFPAESYTLRGRTLNTLVFFSNQLRALDDYSTHCAPLSANNAANMISFASWPTRLPFTFPVRVKRRRDRFHLESIFLGRIGVRTHARGLCESFKYLLSRFSKDGIPHQSCSSSLRRSFQAHRIPFPSFDFDPLPTCSALLSSYSSSLSVSLFFPLRALSPAVY
jgi:hypothetical protein